MNSITKNSVLAKYDAKPFNCKECATEKERIICEIARATFPRLEQLSQIFPEKSFIIGHEHLFLVMGAQVCKENLDRKDLSDLEKEVCSGLLEDITKIIMNIDEEAAKNKDWYIRMLKVTGVALVSLSLIALKIC
jgi:hypothetical protein